MEHALTNQYGLVKLIQVIVFSVWDLSTHCFFGLANQNCIFHSNVRNKKEWNLWQSIFTDVWGNSEAKRGLYYALQVLPWSPIGGIRLQGVHLRRWCVEMVWNWISVR